MARLSPDRVRTVRAVPTSLPPRWKGRRSVAPGRRERLSLMIEVAAPRNASMIAGSTDGAGGFFLSPIICFLSLEGGLVQCFHARAHEQIGGPEVSGVLALLCSF